VTTRGTSTGGKPWTRITGIRVTFLRYAAISSTRRSGTGKTGARIARARIVIKFIHADPDCEVTIDLKHPPGKPG